MEDTGIPIETLYDKTKSMYKLVILASKRALELNEGATELSSAEAKNISQKALQEIAEDKISYKKLKA